jgi:hypothetical protein
LFLAHALDDPDQLVDAVALLAGEADELSRLRYDGATLRVAGDRNAAPTPELEESFVAQCTKRAQDGVPVDPTERGSCSADQGATANTRRAPSIPFRLRRPRSTKRRPDPATTSLTV